MNEVQVAAAPPPVPWQSPFMVMLENAAQAGEIEIVRELRAMYREEEELEKQRLFDAAMARAMIELPAVVTKDAKVGFDSKRGGDRTSYQHATHAAYTKVVKPILGKYGLYHYYEATSKPGEPIEVSCVVAHEKGYRKRVTLHGPADSTGNKNNLQAIGSTLTYLERYTLVASLGLAAEDDDGVASESMGPISADEGVMLMAKINNAGIQLKRFCDKFGIEKLELLPREKLPEAIDAIAGYEAQKAKVQQ